MEQVTHGANAGTSRDLRDRDAEQVWGAFDRLPPVIRRVLWTTPFDQDEVQIEALVREGRAAGYSDAAIVTVLERLIRADVMEQVTDWGPGYPAMWFTPIMPRPGRTYRARRHFLR